jgi:predicted Zn-dependent protease
MANQRPHKKSCAFSVKRLNEQSGTTEDILNLQALLGRYGYLRCAYIPGTYDQATRNAVSQFQAFYRIYPQQDGVCDEQTVTLLSQRRCGVADGPPVERTAHGRLAPFVTVGAKWPTNNLRFRFLNTTSDLDAERQRDIIREAFQRWAAVSALQFHETAIDQASEIAVAFHHGSHGDGFPFDDGGGPDGNTLAHAFFPPPAGGQFAGLLHFDEFEQWKDQPGGLGTRLFNVALHEIGHNLGLAHSQDENAIMFAFYAEDRNDLRNDDIAGIRSLYGAPQGGPIAIAAGQQISGHLGQTGAEVRYQLTLQNKLIIKLDGPNNRDFDVYVRRDGPVGTNPGEHDASGIGVTADEAVTIANPQAGIYNILVHSFNGEGSYNLEVELV